jgi:hypothetical protein
MHYTLSFSVSVLRFVLLLYLILQCTCTLVFNALTSIFNVFVLLFCILLLLLFSVLVLYCTFFNVLGILFAREFLFMYMNPAYQKINKKLQKNVN